MPGAPQALLGRELGNYAVKSILGEGPDAVLAGEHRFHGSRVALKVLQGATAETSRRFLEAAKTAIEIIHPNVSKILDFGQSQSGELYLVLELPAGKSLRAAAKEQRFAESTCARIGVALCDGLSAAEANGLEERALAAGDIFLGANGEPKILDFGIARATRPGPQADVWSMGAILYEMMTGAAPLADPARPSAKCKISPELERLILQCLAKEAVARPGIDEVRERLARFAAAPSTTTATTTATAPSTAPAMATARHATAAPPAPMPEYVPQIALADALVSLDGEEPAEKVTPDELRASAPVVEKAPPAVDIPDEQFAAPSLDSAGMKLELEVAAAPRRPAPPPVEAVPDTPDDPEEPDEKPIDIKPIPGKLMQGALRTRPGVRIGAGVVLGLLIGYAASLPYSDRAARRVAAIRAEADQSRYLNAPEAQATVRELDKKADDMSTSAAVGSIAIWLVLGGAAFGGWWKIT